MYSYLLWLAIFVLLPVTLLWIFNFSLLRKYSSVCAAAVVGAVIVSLPWDYLSIREKIWFFTSPHIVGIWLLGLPLEEWLFIIFVTLLFSSLTIVFWSKWGTTDYVR